MKTNWHSRIGLFALGALLAAAGLVRLSAGQTPAPQVTIDPDDIGGVVDGPRGPEAGVWVIAETDDLPTKFRKIVVTDARGRFVIPDLPRATYRVWVRGYGLVDSKAVTSEPGKRLRLTAVSASTPQQAARIFPPNYWYSLIDVPKKSEFPGTGEKGNGFPTYLRSQAEWLNSVKLTCNNCHQLGGALSRTVDHLKGFKSTAEAWDYRLRIGQRGPGMMSEFEGFGRERSLKIFADWTDRIAAGEVPPTPPRPDGVERNLVLTMWEWAAPTSYIHDMVSTDKRNPTINSNGPIYGLDFGRDFLEILDPLEGSAREVKVPVREDKNRRSYYPRTVDVPSPFWGRDVLWDSPANPHNPMIDAKGRVWMTTQIRDQDDEPEFCKAGSSHPSARLAPLKTSTRQAGFFDPKTQKFTLIDTCFTTHHLQFDSDPDETLYFSDNGPVVTGTIGWVKTRVYDETGDAAKAQGWCPIIIDTNGDGKPGSAVMEPPPAFKGGAVAYMGAIKRAVPPGMDLQLPLGGYGLAVNPVDHSVWGSLPIPFPGRLVRLDPKTCLSEVYEPPMNNPQAPDKHGATPRGVDIDRNGLVWTGLAGTGHTASFDRRKCKLLNGPSATGQHCPEGWTLYPSPGPKFKGVTDPGSADYHYYNWVDQWNTLGLGENVPITNGSGSDSLLAVMPQTGKTVVMRVPYPVGFFTRGLDGRIDDPKTGWKGRGVWANNATNVLWEAEGGKGNHSTVVHFQVRPDPLAK